jgi:hypothetical protein
LFDAAASPINDLVLRPALREGGIDFLAGVDEGCS